jgi:hypothetical protein
MRLRGSSQRGSETTLAALARSAPRASLISISRISVTAVRTISRMGWCRRPTGLSSRRRWLGLFVVVVYSLPEVTWHHMHTMTFSLQSFAHKSGLSHGQPPRAPTAF